MSNLPTEAEFQALEDEIKKAAEALTVLRRRRREMLLAGWDGAETGALVRCTSLRFKAQVGRVVEVRAPFLFQQDRPWVKVALNRKDGTPGGRIVWFFSEWEPV